MAEAIKIVTSQFREFQPTAKTGRRLLQVSGCDKIEDFIEVDGGPEELHIFPAMCGGKRGGFVQMLIGAVLIAASLLLPVGPFIGSLLMNMGIMMLLGGILQLISAPPRDKTGDPNKNRYLGAPGNTVEIGTRIPILYGRDQIGGHYLSFNISAVDTTV